MQFEFELAGLFASSLQSQRKLNDALAIDNRGTVLLAPSTISRKRARKLAASLTGCYLLATKSVGPALNSHSVGLTPK